MSEQLLGDLIIAAGAFLGLVAGFLLNAKARRDAYRETVLAEAAAAVSAVVAATFPVTSVDVPEWSLSGDDRAALRRELELDAGRRLATAAGEAVAALSKASRYLPDLSRVAERGPVGVVEEASNVLRDIGSAR